MENAFHRSLTHTHTPIEYFTVTMSQSDPTVPIADRSSKDVKICNLKRTPDEVKIEALRKTLIEAEKMTKLAPKEVQLAKEILQTGTTRALEKSLKDEAKSTIDRSSDKDQPSSSKDTESCSLEKTKLKDPSNVPVPRTSKPYVPPISNERPLVLSTHLVPSLPLALFELLIEMIEMAIEKPVTLLYEPRSNRGVAKDVTDIAILPANEEWEDGKLLPVSFVFKHRLNKENSACVYADVIVASDIAPHVENIADIRGHRCALPDRSKKIGTTTLLYNYLYSIGEGPAFFGNTLDADTQVAALQMVAGKQAEVSILESPVILCQKNTLPGVESLRVLTSLGPLPPYRIMVNKKLPDVLIEQLTSYLINCNKDVNWMQKLATFGILGFANNSTDLYELIDVKPVVTRAPYY
ncbi:hypothetical protein KPH14_002233 [Odynerus spinipes]|uniref:Uncharacterized protein n=1 Tax=Odynerus spinipes TaxID=1348599 RepID=A0AAD9RL53_9HYME|nr:hypothetical protein KPH14_002233 [Odynerus spinipes]